MARGLKALYETGLFRSLGTKGCIRHPSPHRVGEGRIVEQLTQHGMRQPSKVPRHKGEWVDQHKPIKTLGLTKRELKGDDRARTIPHERALRPLQSI